MGPKVAENPKDVKNLAAQPKRKIIGKDKQGNPIYEPEPEQIQPPKTKEKIIERFIFVTNFEDKDSMLILKNQFERINQKAFNLKSVKEIYTKLLTEEEKNSIERDYVSGFQILDRTIRITIIEGINKKGLEDIKQALPKLQINLLNHQIYADSRILFDDRIYSSFGLCLKFIKLRTSLNEILTTYNIYSKADKYPEIFNTFMNFASILRGPTLEIINNSNLFPIAKNLLLLERQYADILVEEDMTGVKENKKKKKRLDLNLVSLTTNNASLMSKSSPQTKNQNAKLEISKTEMANSINPDTLKDSSINNSIGSQAKEKEDRLKDGANKEKKIKEKALDSHNPHFEEIKRIPKDKPDYSYLNQQAIIELVTKNKGKYTKFCTRADNEEYKGPVYMYSSQRKNYWADYIDQLRIKHEHDNSNFYTYSKEYLNLKLPMKRNSNYEYDDFLENKSKWVSQKDFDRYKQTNKEKIYFPKISNEL